MSKRNNYNKFLKGIFITFLLSFVVPFFAIMFVNEFVLTENTFKNGTCFCGVDLSNLNYKEAEEKLENIIRSEQNNLNLKITYQDKNWVFTDKDFEIKSNIHIVLDELQKSSKKNNMFNKSKLIKKIRKMGFDSKTASNYVLNGIEDKIEKISLEIDTLPVSATAKFNTSNNSVKIIPEQFGKQINKQKLYDDIANNLQNNLNNTIEIETISVLPDYVEKDIVKATKLQSEFSTNYKSSSYDRKSNIRLAVETLHNAVVLPNETFSFNDIVGKRTQERGYKQANIIKDGAFVKGVGGGICQVSTTLYNALLLANINVTEVHKHSLPVSYVSPALDAMVSWSSADLKFKNTTTLPIFISGKTSQDKITFKIYGDTNKDNIIIKTRSEIIKTLPAGSDKIIPDVAGKYSDKIMFKGEFVREKVAKNGYEAKSYIDYYKDNKLVNSKMLRHATYYAQNGIVYEGCEKLPPGMTLPKDKFTTLKTD